MALPADIKRRLGAAIAEGRSSRSQDWLADSLEVHQTTVSKWERGKTAPGIERLPRIERLLGLPLGTLTAIVFDSQPPPPTEVMVEVRKVHAAISEMRQALDLIEDSLRKFAAQ